MYNPNANASPFKPLPPVLVALALLIGGIELVLQGADRGLIGGPAGVGWRIAAVQTFGVSDRMFEYMIATGDLQLRGLWTYVTYLFVHGSLMHALFAIVLLLALGNFASKYFSGLAMLSVFLLSGVAGAVAYGLVLDTRLALIGAYPAVYGILGLYTWMLWVGAKELGQNPYAAFRLIAMLVFIQVGFAMIGGGGVSGLAGDVAGFVAGFLLATPAAPGGFRRLRRKLQGN